MNALKRFFGGKTDKPSTPPPSNPPPPRGGGGAGPRPKNNLEALNDQCDIIEKRQQVLELKINKELEKAKEYLAKKNKNGASQCLQRKKIYESQLTKLQAQYMNVERLKLALEETTMNAEVIRAQRMAAGDLAALQRGMDPETVDRDMDHMRDLMDKTKDVSEALAQDLGGDAMDEDDLEDELAALEQDIVDVKIATTTPVIKQPAQQLPTQGQGVTLPEVPKSKIPVPAVKQPQAEEEDELAALERELNS
eukprot:PhF_6_TR36507/c0_g1_i1/m.53735/K12194/CHMP4, SNF7, VPS32; charged multivesicular body protein 4